MKCRNCNQKIKKDDKNCPKCDNTIENKVDSEPTISRGLVIFIVIGTIFLVAYGIMYYNFHKNDPEYTQTSIEPDSTIADKNIVKFDTQQPDSLSKDSIDSEETKDAERVLKTIRGGGRKRQNKNIKNNIENNDNENIIDENNTPDITDEQNSKQNNNKSQSDNSDLN